MPVSESVVEVRVRYAEVDRMGVAHHTAHFVWFEIGRTEWMRARDLPYGRVEDDGIYLPVVEATCTYHAPARYDDLLRVRSCPAGFTGARVTFSYRIERAQDDALLVTGRTVHATVDGRGRPRRLPTRLREVLS